ncbi:hypothetical protein V1264_008135 [Littorina saxatilis]|uniref:Uncharacterized protein n=1 Tax=Littorina saxatilis TaxID=31220 RepID=A0AAN9ASY0_9CAEN
MTATFINLHAPVSTGAWANNFRILELSAVVAHLLGAVVRRPVGVTAQARASIVISDFGFHSVAVFHAIAFVAIGVLHYLMPLMPLVRMFSFSKYETFFNPLFALYCGEWLGAVLLAITGACCGKGAGRMCLFLGGVVVFLLGVAVMPHKPAYDSFWAYMGLSLGVGFATAFAQVFVSVGVARRTGGIAVGVSVSLLMFWQDMGTLFGIVAVDQLNSAFSLDTALYMSGGFLLFAGLALIVCHFTVKPLIQFRKPFDSDSETSSNGARDAGIANPGLGRWDSYEYDYRYMH